jgi:hypothetical protein
VIDRNKRWLGLQIGPRNIQRQMAQEAWPIAMYVRVPSIQPILPFDQLQLLAAHTRLDGDWQIQVIEDLGFELQVAERYLATQ